MMTGGNTHSNLFRQGYRNKNPSKKKWIKKEQVKGASTIDDNTEIESEDDKSDTDHDPYMEIDFEKDAPQQIDDTEILKLNLEGFILDLKIKLKRSYAG